MEFVLELGLFALKTAFIVGAIAVVLILLFQLGSSRNRGARAQLEVEKLNNRYRSFKRYMQSHLLAKKEFKTLVKGEKKARKKESPQDRRVFVVDFHGDIRAAQTHSLREEVTAILLTAKAGDEVVVRLESGGGLVTHYGLAASQLVRLKAHGIKLTVCVDRVAASGGYMMACVADRILAAPFAVVGSIGVIAQVPNFNKVLKRNDIDYREVTAGEFKRTVTVFGEITETGFQKFKEQIEDTHRLFKSFVQAHRPRLDIAKVATGEHWYGSQAMEMGLVDEIVTSDDYLFGLHEQADLFRVEYRGRKKLIEKVSDSFSESLHKLAVKIWSDLDRTRFGF
jgi:serine protease SohB